MCAPLESESLAEAPLIREPPWPGRWPLVWLPQLLPSLPGSKLSWEPSPSRIFPGGSAACPGRVLACPELPLSGPGGVRVGPVALRTVGRAGHLRPVARETWVQQSLWLKKPLGFQLLGLEETPAPQSLYCQDFLFPGRLTYFGPQWLLPRGGPYCTWAVLHRPHRGPGLAFLWGRDAERATSHVNPVG